MKIIEGLKELKIIEKRLASLGAQVTEYAAIPAYMKPAFKDESEQTKELKSMMQSGEDLVQRYLKLKRDIDYTNVMLTVEMGGKKYSLNTLLNIRRKGAHLAISLWKSLTEERAKTQSLKVASQASPGVVKFYNEQEKNERMGFWQDLYDNIESRLEVINATMDLIEAPK